MLEYFKSKRSLIKNNDTLRLLLKDADAENERLLASNLSLKRDIQRLKEEIEANSNRMSGLEECSSDNCDNCKDDIDLLNIRVKSGFLREVTMDNKENIDVDAEECGCDICGDDDCDGCDGGCDSSDDCGGHCTESKEKYQVNEKTMDLGDGVHVIVRNGVLTESESTENEESDSGDNKDNHVESCGCCDENGCHFTMPPKDK